MKFVAATDSLKACLEKCDGLRFDEDSQYGVMLEIKNENQEPAVFLLNADDTIKLARGLLKLALAAR